MDVLDLGPTVTRLMEVPVTLEGGPCASTGDAETSAWRGAAHATEPLVGIAFVSTPRGTSWLKSRRSWRNAVSVEVGRYGDREAGHLLLTLGSCAWPERAPELDELPRAHRASFAVWGCDAPATSIPPRMLCESGRPVRVLHVPDAGIAVDLLLLPRAEIATRRAGIWTLKRRGRDEVPEPLRHVLCFGRVGTWPPYRRKGQTYGP